MKKSIKLLLLAALALPVWVATAAQDDVPQPVMAVDLSPATQVRQQVGAGEPKNGPFNNAVNVSAPRPHKAGPTNVSLTPERMTKIGAVTVADGSATNEYVPIYGYYYDNEYAGNNQDYRTRSQMIYPADMLVDLKGKAIRSLTFYANSSGIQFGNTDGTNGELTIKIGNCIASSFNNTTMQEFSGGYATATISPKKNATEFTVTFSAPFEYNSGNILVDVTVTTSGNAGTTNFIGVSTTSIGYQSLWYRRAKNNNQTSRVAFLPKMTLCYEYEGNAPVSGNRDFFHDITYSWKENGVGAEHTGHLDDIATDPDQIIAMLREVYTNKKIPGNYKRGYLSSGAEDPATYGNVSYTGAGALADNSNNIVYSDSYGWNIPGEVVYGGKVNVTGGSYQYWYMNPEQYKPEQEGLTLLLLEMVDTFDPKTVSFDATSGYAQLRELIAKTIKSARVVTDAKRTGKANDPLSAGTMFKIDCDKMNKFYLIAKGQLQWLKAPWYVTQQTGALNFYTEPCYLYGSNTYYRDYSYETATHDEYVDPGLHTYFFLGHMFEQFSPSLGNATESTSDLYQSLINMESFGVVHDCPNVPYVENGHHFMMYGKDSNPDDCQDVRDMMFFVPDYRMMDHTDRGTEANSGIGRFQDYFRYHPAHMPTMGMFVIRQDAIPEGTTIKSDETTMTGLYKHQLQWESNLDDFLPGDEQEYQLWEVVVDEFGVESYQPVYYRNADGEYTDGSGTVVGEDNKVPIVLERQNLSEFTYTDVYVDMKAGSQTKTYVIRGRDKGNFLSLQQSNQQEIVIPGLDPKEKVRMIGATYYSRYNPDNEKNCYSNKLEMKNNATGLTRDDTGKTLYFYRSSRKAQVDENGNVVTDDNGNIQYVGNDEVEKTCFAKGTFSGNNLSIELLEQADKAEYPDGKTDGDAAGYHTNKSPLTFQYTTTNGVLNFGDLYFWDNFTVDVSKNVHPLQYLYKMEAKTDEDADADAYSNDVRVPVYKTDSKINGALTIDQVVADTQMNPDYSPGDVEFEAKVQLSSKTEILRYDAYRWIEKKNDNEHYYIIDEFGEDDNHNETESDLPPTGIAGNQGDFYTVSMNKVQEPEYYYVATEADQPVVSTDQPSNWAKFVDKYPLKQAQDNNVIDSYVYAPVVELFTKGYKPNKVNNKMVERDDYNTYGGPLKRTALGKLEVKAYQPTDHDEGTDMAQMSEYKWFKDGEWYSYYNIYLNFKALDVPAGYELYKVRAWRQVTDKSILGEEVSSRAGRANYDGDWYMYEDMNFGDPLEISDGSATQPDVMSLSKLKGNGFNLGYRSNKIAKPVNPDGTGGGPVFEYDLTPNPNADNAAEEELIKHEMRATFGAKRLKTPKDDSGSLTELNAKFKVRAYFTKNTNPLTNASFTPEAKPIYVIGDIGNGWSNEVAAAELYSDNGTRYTGHIDIPGTNGKGYIRFTRELNTPGEFFGANAEGNWIVNDEHYNTPLELKYWKSDSRPFEIPAGSYNLTIDLKPLSEAGDDNGWDAGTLTITRGSVAVNAPRRAAMPGSDYDYYIAEGETKNIRLEGSSIITGISGVKADLNREVVSVTYVNPLGQQSSRPFSGVNMVITRYSDGSATTTKVVK